MRLVLYITMGHKSILKRRIYLPRTRTPVGGLVYRETRPNNDVSFMMKVN